MNKGTFLVTGASDGIGAVYAERLAARDHDLILVARRAEKLAALAERLETQFGVSAEVIAADLADAEGLDRIEARPRDDEAITGLVNNAGIAGETRFVEADPAHLSRIIDLNITAVVRLTAAIAPRLARLGGGTVINLSSVTALMPGRFSAVYPASKAFVLTFSEALQAELGPFGVRVQAVVPGITRTPIWSEATLASLPSEMVMDVGEMVDAALRGLDLGETITIPSLPDAADLEAYLAARTALHPNLSRDRASRRYGL